MCTAHLIDADVRIWSENAHSLSSHLSLALTDMMLPEQKLTVEITCLNCVHVNLQHDSHQPGRTSIAGGGIM